MINTLGWRTHFLLKKWKTLVIAMLWSLSFVAQSADAIILDTNSPTLSSEYDQSYFLNPVGHKIILAGSFGELRSNHFHAGLDIKPQKHGTSEPVMLAADGYISRVKIQRAGYGRALYVNHPNGYTTVYAHLARFSDTLEQYIEKMQYKLESFEVDIYLQANDFKLNKGTVIGQMGSTGRSFSHHLHFEIRETKSEIPINPILFGIAPEDHKAPLINSLSIHALDPDMVVLNRFKYATKGTKKGKYSLNNTTISVPAWNVGLAVHSFDKMDGGNNTNGIYSLRMYVDDSLYYGFDLDKISFGESYYINGHIDYHTKMAVNSTYQQCYQLPGNTLSIYKQDGDGRIKLYKDKPRHVRIEVKDLSDNLSTLIFNIKRDPNMEDIQRPEYNFKVSYERGDSLNFGNIEAFVAPHTFYKKNYINCTADMQSMTFNIANKKIPLRKSIYVKVKGLPNDSLVNKRCIAYKHKDKWISYGGIWDGENLSTYVRKVGEFKVMVDNKKPSIKIHKFPKALKKSSSIQMKVSDNLETKGSAKNLEIKVYIDGKWQLYQYKSMSKLVIIHLHENIQKGKHSFVLMAEDDRGNVSEYRRSFEIL